MQRWVVSLYPQARDYGWSPGRGLFKGIAATGGLALCLSGVVCSLAWYSPFLLVDDLLFQGQSSASWTRAFPWGFGVSGILGAVVGWIMLETMYRTSGMSGELATCLGLLFAIVVIASKHVLFAFCGVELAEGFVEGWIWISPEYLMWYSYGSWVGLWAVLFWRCLTEQ